MLDLEARADLLMGLPDLVPEFGGRPCDGDDIGVYMGFLRCVYYNIDPKKNIKSKSFYFNIS